MKEIIIATKNKGKAKDFEELLEPMGYKVLTLHDVAPHLDVEETGETFEENAVLKAETIAQELQATVIADDSGLEIDALNGEPGVYSARYSGEEKNDDSNIDKVLQKLVQVPDDEKTARFRCVLALASPGKETIIFEGAVDGLITDERKGDNGFGYDPIFYVPALEKTMAEMKPSEKAAVSHRGNAIRELGKAMPGL
ncbi:XTP/dITP diphosphatase [Planococcus halotolerans]|uniref:dITP/XTP pyrophosphatase n=1 Tax=Planococcus halotolerans TaxID=2233542 RepID=A0A365KM00_9BACL|nr:XTP/dITP diphosphatase [Planococcus halotolerans]QHJ71635.1 XTP/dITP diphosphatase [Planococcus halotolerans]RAZ74149.1 non-canonical purine NTP pyrophosphatase [Planococcus halotolerans]